MSQQLRFHWYRLQYRFAEALACRERSEATDDGTLWTCYRLGLYQTVAESGVQPKGWPAMLALAASLAAVGETERAAEQVRRLLAGGLSASGMTAVAKGMAPFAPDLALTVAKHPGVPVCLRAGLLLRTGQTREAADLIHGAKRQDSHPELELLRGNLTEAGNRQRIAHLNAFLAHFPLKPLELEDPSLPPGPLNLRSAADLPASGGPLVSVLMTTFRSASRLEASVRSLLAQTYRDLEVIVVDDSSDDETWSVIQAIAAEDARVRCFRLPCNAGTYVAKTFGFSRARGEFVTCHDSDDWAHPLRIEFQIRPFQRNRHLVCTTSEWVRLQDDGICYARQVHPLQRLNPASPFFRRERVRDRAGLWDPVRTGADSEFLSRLKLVFGRFAVKRIALPLTFGSHRPDSLMTAAATGHTKGRVSPDRLAYWEAWTRWQVDELRQGRRPQLPSDPRSARRFPAPDALLVPIEDVVRCSASQ